MGAPSSIAGDSPSLILRFMLALLGIGGAGFSGVFAVRLIPVHKLISSAALELSIVRLPWHVRQLRFDCCEEYHSCSFATLADGSHGAVRSMTSLGLSPMPVLVGSVAETVGSPCGVMDE